MSSKQILHKKTITLSLTKMDDTVLSKNSVTLLFIVKLKTHIVTMITTATCKENDYDIDKWEINTKSVVLHARATRRAYILAMAPTMQPMIKKTNRPPPLRIWTTRFPISSEVRADAHMTKVAISTP